MISKVQLNQLLIKSSLFISVLLMNVQSASAVQTVKNCTQFVNFAKNVVVTEKKNAINQHNLNDHQQMLARQLVKSLVNAFNIYPKSAVYIVEKNCPHNEIS